MCRLVCNAGEPDEGEVTHDKQQMPTFTIKFLIPSRESLIADLGKGLTPIDVMGPFP